MTVGDRIRFLRNEQGLTQDDLGRMCGVNKQLIYKYEVGIITNIPSNRLELLANALQTTPAYLMGWSDNPDAEWFWDGTHLQKMRKQIGVTIEDTASAICISASSYRAIENSSMRPTMDVLIRLSDFFHCTIDFFVRPGFLPSPGNISTLTPADLELLYRYHNAPQEIRTIVDTALAPYGEKSAVSGL